MLYFAHKIKNRGREAPKHNQKIRNKKEKTKMKKAVAMVLVVVMMLAFGVTAFAAQGPLTVEQAKQVALDYAGLKAADATFTKAHGDYDDGRQVYEIEFYANNTEYDMDVDVNTGRVTDFSTEYHGVYNQPAYSCQPVPNTQTTVTTYGYYYDDDMYDFDDRYDFDEMYEFDDMFDFD